jgi:hypothetical protein
MKAAPQRPIAAAAKMAELVLLTLTRNEVDDPHRVAGRHDPAALAFWERLLDEHPATALGCFLCDCEIEYPPHAFILPDL